MSKKFLQKNSKTSMRELFLENKGQAGAVFRLMVDAIIGLAILMIILSSINYFNDLRIKTSISEFNSLVESAVNAPDGKVVESGDLIFSKGAGFTSTTLQSLTGVAKECFQFQSNLGLVEVSPTKYSIEMKQNTETKVYAQCYPSQYAAATCSDASLCDICCVISFGRKLT